MSKKNKPLDIISKDIKNEKKSRKQILDDIDDIDYIGSSSFLPSFYLKESKKDNAEPKVNRSSDEDSDSWLSTISNLMGKPSKRSIKNAGKELFETLKPKKKKKKQKEGELVNYRKEFEPEIALLHSLLSAQNKFVNSLQRDYDSIADRKSTNRYNTKNMNDLIANITSARSLASQIVDKQVSVKKLISELTLKQKKEFGITDNGSNLNDYASSFLKQMISERKSLNGDYSDTIVGDFSDEELSEELESALENDSYSDETMKYLKYENQNVKIYVVIRNKDIDNYEFVALDDNNHEIDDYPLPSKSKLSINYNTNVATDSYGEKYNIIFVEE